MSDTDERELTLRDYARVVARRKWIVVVAVVVTVGAALGLAALQEPIYQAEAQMLVKTRPSDTIFNNGASANVNDVRAISTEIEVLKSQVVSERVRTDLAQTSDVPPVKGTTVGATDVVAVRVRSTDPTTARILADGYVQAYISVKREQAVGTLVAAGSELQSKVTELQDQIDTLDDQVADASAADRDELEAGLSSQRRILVDQQALFKQRLDQLQVDAALATGGAQVVRQAEQPTDPVEPQPLRTGALALAVGLLLGLGAAFLFDYLDDSIRSVDEMERASGGLPVLAVVPVDPPLDNRPISISKPGDYAVETYRALRTGLQFLNLDGEVRVIQVTSPLSGEGKTTTATNLAVVFAQAGLRVVLVDADLRKPRVHQTFGIDPTHGLTDALLGEPFETLVKAVIPNLEVLASGRIPPNPSELLGGGQMRSLIARLAAEYDVVILDSAPVLPVTDSVALAASVQGVILVTQAGRTGRKQVGQALSLLGRVRAPLLGTVLNKVGGKRKSDADGYGYGYGGAYGTYGAAVTGRPLEPAAQRPADGSVTDVAANGNGLAAALSGGATPVAPSSNG